MFKELAYNKAPRGFRYTNGLLTYKVRSRTFDKTITQNDPRAALIEATEFMQTHGSILSSTDGELKRRDMKERLAIMSENEVSSWSQIRTSAHRTILINNFVTRVSRAKSLPPDKTRQLEHLLRLGILAGYFNSTTIHVQKGLITAFEGLVETSHGAFEIVPAIIPKIKKASKSKKLAAYDDETSSHTADGSSGLTGHADEDVDMASPGVSFVKLWVKFLSNMEKRTSKRASLPIPIPSGELPRRDMLPLPHSV